MSVVGDQFVVAVVDIDIDCCAVEDSVAVEHSVATMEVVGCASKIDYCYTDDSYGIYPPPQLLVAVLMNLGRHANYAFAVVASVIEVVPVNAEFVPAASVFPFEFVAVAVVAVNTIFVVTAAAAAAVNSCHYRQKCLVALGTMVLVVDSMALL
jgi:hypothetical protein